MVIAYPGTQTFNDVLTDLSSWLHVPNSFRRINTFLFEQSVLFNQRNYDVAKGFYDHYHTIQLSESPDNSFPGFLTFDEVIILFQYSKNVQRIYQAMISRDQTRYYPCCWTFFGR